MDGMKNSWQVSGYRDWYDCYINQYWFVMNLGDR